MKPVNLPRKDMLIIAGCATLPLIVGVFCVMSWRAMSKARDVLARESGSPVPSFAGRSELVELDERKSELSRQNAKLTSQMAEMNIGKSIPAEDRQKEMMLELLALAGNAGLHVQEVNNLGVDPKAWTAAINSQQSGEADGSSNGPAQSKFLTRFSPDGTKRPLIRLRCEGQYAAVRKFLNDLAELSWKPTPVMFDIGQNQTSVISSYDNPDTPTAAPQKNNTGIQTLNMTIIISL